MRNNVLTLSSALLLFVFAGCNRDAASCCDVCDCSPKSAATPVASTDSKESAPRHHPLKGIVTDLVPDRSALMVKHEEIPGVMKAMTMLLTVDPSILQTVKKGDAVTGLLSHDGEGTWRLDEVKVITPAK